LEQRWSDENFSNARRLLGMEFLRNTKRFKKPCQIFAFVGEIHSQSNEKSTSDLSQVASLFVQYALSAVTGLVVAEV